jgi:hypothetical protein
MRLTNTGEGPRGVWIKDGTLRMIDPGATWEGELADFEQRMHPDLREGEPEQLRLESRPEDEEIRRALEGLSPEARERFFSVMSPRAEFTAMMEQGGESPSVTSTPTAVLPQAPSNSDATGEVNNPQDLAASGAPDQGKAETPKPKEGGEPKEAERGAKK